jgi:hypothetical protein
LTSTTKTSHTFIRDSLAKQLRQLSSGIKGRKIPNKNTI